jgi:hypothetical protein
VIPPRWCGRVQVLRLLFIAGVLVALALTAACGGGSDDGAMPGAAVAIDDPFSGGYPTYDHEATGLRIVFGTPDLGPGRSRVSFALFGYDGLVSYPALALTTRFYPAGASGGYHTVETASLPFHRFPEGGRGIYAGMLDFDRAGLWALDLTVPQADGTVAEVLFPVEVKEQAAAPVVGALAPASVNRTAADVAALDELTTASEPKATLYDTTIAAALSAKRPFVLTFASPAFCTNALCGPQVEVLSELEADYGSDADFIHVDLYENPQEIRGDLSLARRTPVLDEWGIHTDEWTFIVGADGRIAARFEGFAPREEVEAALRATLGRP